MLAGLLALAVLGYVSVGAGGVGAGLGVLVSLGLVLLALRLARDDLEQAAVVRWIASRALMLLPGALVVYLGYHAGGFFPGPASLVAVLLALVLGARLVVGGGSGPGDRAASAVGLLLAAYAAWVLVSGAWSHAPERALVEANLAFVYLIGFVLFATSVTGPRDLRWVMRGLAAGASVVCLGGFAARALPKLWPIATGLDTSRISYPITYWNGLGLLAALGIILCLGLTTDDGDAREPTVLGRLGQAASALPIPLLAVTLLLTFSRGAIGAGIVGLVAYLLVGRPRSLLTAAIAAGPPTAVAVVVAYRATSLAHSLDGSALQANDGRHLALVVAGCSVAAALLRGVLTGVDTRLLRLGSGRPAVPLGVARRRWGIFVALVVVGALAAGLPGVAVHQWDRFVQGNVIVSTANLRDRLTFPGADGRISEWRIALDELRGAPVQGTGAGTYEVYYAAHRPDRSHVLDTHSIYLENLGELGVVGLGLLACVILGSLAAVARRARGPERTLYATVFAALVAWTIHAGVDWDWELSAVTLPVFVLAGAALWRAPSASGAPARAVLALAVVLAAAAPALLSVSQSHLDPGATAFSAEDCATATSEARSSLSPLGFRHAAHEILGYCAAAAGRGGPAAAEMTSAVDDDPENWETQYGLAVVLGAAGRDPRPAIRAAAALNPREEIVTNLATRYRRDPRSRWPLDAANVPLPVAGHYGAVLAGLRAAGRPAAPRRARPLRRRPAR